MTAEKSSQSQLRPLGFLETFFLTRSRIGVDSCVVVAARYESSTGRPLDKSIFFSALEDVVHDHSELAVRVTGNSRGSPTWIPLSFLDFDQLVDFANADSGDLGSLLEEQFLRPFNLKADLPLWRLVVLSDGTIIFAYDHTIGDGQSGLAFHLSLLAALQKVPEPPEEHLGAVAPRHDVLLLPPIEHAMRVPVSVTKLLREVKNAVSPFTRRSRAALWGGNPIPRAFKFGVHVRMMQVSPEDTARLVRRCRDHHTTVTGALYALIAHVLAHLLHQVPSRKRKTRSIGVFVPVSLRRYTGAPPTAICNHVSYYQAIHKLPSPSPSNSSAFPPLTAFPWEAAARFSEILKREAPRTPAVLGVMNVLVGTGESYSRGLLGKKRETTLEISNLGPVPSLDTGSGGAAPWSIREALFAQADATLGAALKVNATGTPAGGLGVSLTWGKESLEEAFALECVAAFVEGLKELASSTVS